MEARLRQALQTHWGYDLFRPLQCEAMRTVMQGRDSVVVLPTGGGKSLCYQVPALCREGLAVVVSPLISLMQDQVQALRGNGISAHYANSTQSPVQRQEVEREVRSGRLKLLYVSPERLLTSRMLELLTATPLSLIAVDEAHCVSMWGHDFRPEYRALSRMRTLFPEVSVHAFTATASEQVRQDIADQLQLRDPEVLVGSFDRPNLTYRVLRRSGLLKQVLEVLKRHPGESGIIYCITKRQVEELCRKLVEQGYRARPYHADLDDNVRQRNQQQFIQEQIDVIVATVAFGMGIDKPNVRLVIHAGMPKSVEHYQQESGRAGRDGLDAECCLFYSEQDYMLWRRIIEEGHPDAQEAARLSLARMADFCRGVSCRHQALVGYFGQQLPHASCGACDVCLGELELVEDPTTIGQMILSCVLRLKEQYGGEHTAKVLSGSTEQRVVERQHDRLSTFGLLSHVDKRTIRDWIEQLVEQDFLAKSGEYRVLSVTARGRELLRREHVPRLSKPSEPRPERNRGSRQGTASWEGVDRTLFERLRQVRRMEAEARGVPAYVVFGDAALRDMARQKPRTLAAFRLCHGVGQRKLTDYGERFVGCVLEYLQEQNQDQNRAENRAD